VKKQFIHTEAAPAAIGPYSQAIRAGDTVYVSGQIGLDPATGTLRDGIEAQSRQVFANLKAVAEAAGGSLDQIVKLTEIMAAQFRQPYPARATYQVAALPRGARIEVEAVLALE